MKYTIRTPQWAQVLKENSRLRRENKQMLELLTKLERQLDGSLRFISKQLHGEDMRG